MMTMMILMVTMMTTVTMIDIMMTMMTMTDIMMIIMTRLAASGQEVSVRRRESKMAGEQLMRLLETLDGISLGQDMFELRARRKKAAARINSLMDNNDSNIQVTTKKWSLRFLLLPSFHRQLMRLQNIRRADVTPVEMFCLLRL